jgi:hypothetical protein
MAQSDAEPERASLRTSFISGFHAAAASKAKGPNKQKTDSSMAWGGRMARVMQRRKDDKYRIGVTRVQSMHTS